MTWNGGDDSVHILLREANAKRMYLHLYTRYSGTNQCNMRVIVTFLRRSGPQSPLSKAPFGVPFVPDWKDLEKRTLYRILRIDICSSNVMTDICSADHDASYPALGISCDPALAAIRSSIRAAPQRETRDINFRQPPLDGSWSSFFLAPLLRDQSSTFSRPNPNCFAAEMKGAGVVMRRLAWER